MQKSILNFTDLTVWQSAHELVIALYSKTKQFPKEEMFGLTSQIRRAAISIPSNIAEGFGRKAQGEKRHFYTIAAGSLTEVQSQLYLSKDLGFKSACDFEELYEMSISVYRQLNALIAKFINP